MEPKFEKIEFIQIPVVPMKELKLNVDLEPIQSKLDSKFLDIKQRVNAAKQCFDNMKPAEFAKLSATVDAYYPLKYKIHEIGYEVSSNATLKIHELLFHYIPPPRQIGHRVFCNCELPGAMLYDIIKTFPECNWLASSYLESAGPTYHEILDDRYGLYKADKDRWIMGQQIEGTDKIISGDVTDVVVVKELARIVNTRLGGAMLYTSDAGFNVESDFDAQEEQTMMVNYGQVLSGLVTLSAGGILITKQYMISHPFNRSLIALLSTLFETLYITKPLTSRPMNSEIYLIGIGFKGISEELSSYLYSRLQHEYDYKLFIAPLCTVELETEKSMLDATNKIHGQQIRYIETSMKINENIEKYKKTCKTRAHLLSTLLFGEIFSTSTVSNQ